MCAQMTPSLRQHTLSASHTPSHAQGKIKSLESIYLFSMPVKECQIVDYFLGPSLKDEVMKIMPVQKQTRAGQRTRFKVGAWLWLRGCCAGCVCMCVCGRAAACLQARTCTHTHTRAHTHAVAYACVHEQQ